MSVRKKIEKVSAWLVKQQKLRAIADTKSLIKSELSDARFELRAETIRGNKKRIKLWQKEINNLNKQLAHAQKLEQKVFISKKIKKPKKYWK